VKRGDTLFLQCNDLQDPFLPHMSTSAYTSAEQLILKRQLIRKLGSEKRGQIISSGGCK
jgi:hypothetical protein